MPPILRPLTDSPLASQIPGLLRAARSVRMTHAAEGRTRYSDFLVGSAFLFADGSVSEGMNVECVDYLGTHAEEAAIVAMYLVRNKRLPVMLVTVGAAPDVREDDAPIIASCGSCRQKIYELLRMDGVDDIDVIVIDPADGQPKLCSIRELLPLSFGF